MKLTLINKKEEVAGVISFVFQPEQPLTWIAGQFMQYHFLGEKRYFTISSAPHEQNIMLTTRFSDPGSDFKKALKNMQVGQSIEATGPHGSFTLEDPSKNYVFLAGGIGITPFRAILLDLAHKKEPINITLLYANRDQNIVFKNELESLTKTNPNFKIHYFINNNQLDQNKLLQIFNSTFYILHSTFFLSGPEPFVLSMEKLLSDLGVLDENIKRDYFPGYDRI